VREAIETHAPERVVNAIKAAQDPMSLGSVGAQLSPFTTLASAFMNSLATFGAFDRMLASMLQLPLRTKVTSITSTITGVSLAESDVKRVGSLALSAADLDVTKVAAVIALTEEILVGGTDGGLAFLERELRQAVSVATDVRFLSLISVGATSFPSSGANVAAIRQDLRNLIQTISLGAASRLFLVMQPDAVAAWASVGGDSGPAFPGLSYNGGNAAGIPVISTDGCPSGQIILADAAGIAANSEGLRVDQTSVASLNMDSAPDSPPIAATAYVNLWQQNMVGLKVERFFGAKPVRANSVVIVTGANYTGGSPS
jgi:hypothetical protein